VRDFGIQLRALTASSMILGEPFSQGSSPAIMNIFTPAGACFYLSLFAFSRMHVILRKLDSKF
jgi:hypothetical protein